MCSPQLSISGLVQLWPAKHQVSETPCLPAAEEDKDERSACAKPGLGVSMHAVACRCCTAICARGCFTTLLIAVTSSCACRCYAVDEGRLLQSLRQHKDIVTCIAVGPFTLNTGKSAVPQRMRCLPGPALRCLAWLPARLHPTPREGGQGAYRISCCLRTFSILASNQHAHPSCSLHVALCAVIPGVG